MTAIDPLALIGIIIGIVGYILMQISGRITAFITFSFVAIGGLILGVTYSGGFVKYFLIGLLAVVSVYFIKRLAFGRAKVDR